MGDLEKPPGKPAEGGTRGGGRGGPNSRNEKSSGQKEESGKARPQGNRQWNEYTGGWGSKSEEKGTWGSGERSRSSPSRDELDGSGVGCDSEWTSG